MSKLRVNDVLPANGLNIGIGTAGGNLIVGGASTTVVVNGDINITGNVTGSSGATFTNITVGANNGFHVDGGAPASSLTVNNVGDTVVGSGNSVYLADGNLVFQTTGTGIDFSGVGIASTSASSSVLDDYEEGAWNPRILGSPTAGTTTHTQQWGSYTKIGTLVTLRGYVNWSSATGSGSLHIYGIPFLNRDHQFDAIAAGPCMNQSITYPSGYTMASMYIPTGSDHIEVYFSGNGVGWDKMDMEGSGAFIFDISYRTA